MDAWELAIWIFGGYVAVVTLVRLMIQHRNRTMQRFRAEMEKHKPRTEGPRESAGRRTA
jgi:hypothetical protein